MPILRVHVLHMFDRLNQDMPERFFCILRAARVVLSIVYSTGPYVGNEYFALNDNKNIR